MSVRGFEPPDNLIKKSSALPPELISHNKLKCPVPESNQRHTDFQSVALPTELTGTMLTHRVAGIGFEPMTSGL